MHLIGSRTAGDELTRIAIVMPSCDRYASLWPLSLSALDRYWPGRPAATYLITNHSSAVVGSARVLAIGDDVSWSDNLLLGLRAIHEEYVFLALDDLVMMPGANIDRLNWILAHAVRSNWNYLRVNPLPPPAQADSEGLGESLPGEAYRSATVWSLWKRDVLVNVLRPAENAWQFEKTGSSRTDQYGGWWASSVWTVPYVNVVTSGRADPDALRRLQEAGFDASAVDFPLMTASEYGRHRWRLLRSRALGLVPRRFRRTVLALLAKP